MEGISNLSKVAELMRFQLFVPTLLEKCALVLTVG